MNALIELPLVQISIAEALAGSPQWWPTLHLKKGRQLQEITVAQCRILADEYRTRQMNDGKGGRESPPIKLYDERGRKVAEISWNGRIWSIEGHEIGAEGAEA